MRKASVWSLLLGFTVAAAPASGAVRRARSDASLLPVGSVSELSWLSEGLVRGQTFRLTPEPWREILERYLEPHRNHTPEWRTFYRGAFGPAQRAWLPTLCWGVGSCSVEAPEPGRRLGWAESFELRGPELLHLSPELSAAVNPLWSLEGRPAPAPELVAVTARRPCPRWKAPRPVTIMRYAGEVETMTLTDCGGALDSEALDKLSVLARPPGAARPPLPLPIEPEGDAGEWTPQVRLLAPRLAWAISELARAFPGRAVVLMSGYRPDSHSGHHGKGEALDLYVRGVTNEDLFAVCRTLRDAGCGYYPYNSFVHLDVRPFGTGRVAWVDVSQPGAKSEYVDGWPGVLASGSGWLGSGGN
jgi:hypothetical protein